MNVIKYEKCQNTNSFSHKGKMEGVVIHKHTHTHRHACMRTHIHTPHSARSQLSARTSSLWKLSIESAFRGHSNLTALHTLYSGAWQKVVFLFVCLKQVVVQVAKDDLGLLTLLSCLLKSELTSVCHYTWFPVVLGTEQSLL